MSRNGPVAAIVAAYNAQETIGKVVSGARRHVGTVIVADDGSRDGTARVARDAGADVLVLGENRGKGNALRMLFAEAGRRGFPAVIALDADGQHDPDDIPAFLRAHHDHPEAIITGSRMGTPEQIPADRWDSMLVARFFISLAANQFIEDTQCGFRLYPLAVVGSLALLTERYVTETELLIKAGDSGREVRCLPIQANYAPGQPSHFRNIHDIALIARYVISYLMVKWGIEAFKPGVVNTYRGPGTGRDAFRRSRQLDWLFEAATVIVALPLTGLYALWHVTARLFSLRVVCSLSRSGIRVGSLVCSVMLLPALLAVSIVDLLGKRMGIRLDLSTGFVRRHYSLPCQPKPAEGGSCDTR
jgi:glycosyltransferase involved in cell wall biosynthesis